MDIRSKLIISRPLYLKDDECGYCHHSKPLEKALAIPSWRDHYKSKGATKTPPSISIGFQVENMTVDQYDQLINRGYRRSGTFLYRPDMLRGCCRMYTIRTNHELFKLTKEHRQTVNKFNKRIGVKRDDASNGFDLGRELQRMDQSERLNIKFEDSVFTKGKYKLFTKYQNIIHDDYKTSERSFKRFLCDTPFHQSGKILDNKVVEYGAIHQCYYLDEKLIAIGFLDILPSGISSIYLIYDPDYRDLSLGKISGLKEMELSHKLGLKYYYLGYFIEDCPKMNYKKKFGGEILDLIDLKYYKYDEVHKFMINGEFCVIDSQNHDNIVEDLYGIEGVEFLKAKESAKLWDGIDYSTVNNEVLIEDDDDTNPYDIPTVIPGVTTLDSLYNNWDTNQLRMMIFEDGIIRPIIFDLEDIKIKRIIIDILRLIGIELFNQSIVFC